MYQRADWQQKHNYICDYVGNTHRQVIDLNVKADASLDCFVPPISDWSTLNNRRNREDRPIKDNEAHDCAGEDAGFAAHEDPHVKAESRQLRQSD